MDDGRWNIEDRSSEIEDRSQAEPSRTEQARAALGIGVGRTISAEYQGRLTGSGRITRIRIGIRAEDQHQNQGGGPGSGQTCRLGEENCKVGDLQT